MEQPTADPARSQELPDGERRRLDDVFGDVLPEVTRDETGGTPDDRPVAADEWLHANRPPHHDDRG